MTKYIEFDFAIYDMTEAQADGLLNWIIHEVESMGLELGGGFVGKDDEDLDEQKETGNPA